MLKYLGVVSSALSNCACWTIMLKYVWLPLMFIYLHRVATVTKRQTIFFKSGKVRFREFFQKHKGMSLFLSKSVKSQGNMFTSS